MNSFESEFNITHKILKNDETCTNLRIEQEHQHHYRKYQSIYHSKYNSDDIICLNFENILIDAYK